MQDIHNGIRAAELEGAIWRKSQRSNSQGACVREACVFAVVVVVVVFVAVLYLVVGVAERRRRRGLVFCWGVMMFRIRSLRRKSHRRRRRGFVSCRVEFGRGAPVSW